jgi:hypothetical protein
MNRLIFSFSPDDYGSAELHACVYADGFSGSGSAWFNIDALKDFCASLAAYPIDPKSPPSLEGGYWEDGGKKLSEAHLSVRVEPYGGRGALKVNVHLRDPAAMNEPADRARSVSTWFVVGYNDLQRFGTAFAKVLGGVAEEAVLTSTLG